MVSDCACAALLALFMLAASAHAQGRKVQSEVRVSVTLTPAPSVCATQGGTVASVTCLTDNSPVFSVPGRPDVVAVSISASQSGVSLLPTAGSTSPLPESAAQVPSSVNVNNLGPTAAGGEDGRTIESATLSAPAGARPPEEIEVSF